MHGVLLRSPAALQMLIIRHRESAIHRSMDAPEISAEQAAQLTRIDAMVVAGRACGTCTLCCKVVAVTELAKAAGQWCVHCRPGRGCGIHPTRPFVCRGAYCEWMICKGLGPEWKPEKAMAVILSCCFSSGGLL